MHVDLAQLEDHLQKLPAQIRDQELKVVEADHKVEQAELKFDVDFGTELIKSKRPNATEKKSEATTMTQPSAEELIEAKYNLAKEEASLHYLENRFIAMRKISSIEEGLLRANISGN